MLNNPQPLIKPLVYGSKVVEKKETIIAKVIKKIVPKKKAVKKAKVKK